MGKMCGIDDQMHRYQIDIFPFIHVVKEKQNVRDYQSESICSV